MTVSGLPRCRDHQPRHADRGAQPCRRFDVKQKKRQQRAVHPTRIHLRLAGEPHTQDAHQLSCDQDRQKQQIVEVEMVKEINWAGVDVLTSFHSKKK